MSQLEMTEEQRSLIEKEDKYRAMFAMDKTNPELQDKFLLLHKVFDHRNDYQAVEESSEEKNQPHILEINRCQTKGYTVVNRESFFNNWNEYTNGIFDGLDWSNIFCAGGCILGNIATDNNGYRGKDIDLFIYGVQSDDEANRILKRIHDCVNKNTKGNFTTKQTMNAITIITPYPFRPVQIILRQYQTPAEVLLGFDIDSCTVGYDGNDVYAMDRFKRSMTKFYNLVNLYRRSTIYESRLFKYSLRGFAVIVPYLRMNDVRKDLFNNQTAKTMTGLGKLLYYNHTLKSNKDRRITSNPESIKESDYAGELDIPYGSNYTVERIERILNSKDRKRFFSIVMNNKKLREKGMQPSLKPTRLIENITFDNEKPVQHITWIKDMPAYQDLDNNHRRLIVGSFNLPPLNEKWDEGVYEDGITVETPKPYHPPGYVQNNQEKSSGTIEKSYGTMSTKSYGKTVAKSNIEMDRNIYRVNQPEPKKSQLKSPQKPLNVPFETLQYISSHGNPSTLLNQPDRKSVV